MQRVGKHKEKVYKGFTKRYNVTKFVYYEEHGTIRSAIQREKQLKAGSRKQKMDLINSQNPEWKDLYDELVKL